MQKNQRSHSLPTLAFKSECVKTVIATLAFSGAMLVMLPAQAFSEPEFQQALKQLTSTSGETEAAEKFTALLKNEPDNPLLMAYAGAATSKLATTTIFPWKKMAYAEEGLGMIDKSLQLVQVTNSTQMHGATPVVLEVKFAAANTFLAVPKFMNREERGTKLLAEVLQHGSFEQTELGFRGAVWMLAAKHAIAQKNTDQARKLLNFVIQSAAPQTANAQRLLKELA